MEGDALRSAVMHQAPPPIPGLDKKAWRVIEKAMAKRRRDRYPSCTGFARALAVAAGIPLASDPLWQRAVFRKILAGFGMALVALASLTVYMAMHRPEVNPPDTVELVVDADQLAGISAMSYRALVIGIDRYEKNWPRLNNAVNDARLFSQVIASNYNFTVTTLFNEEATREGVVGALGNHFAGACPQDTVIIYFAGHGATDPLKPDDAFLLVHDTNTENMVATGVSMARVYELLKKRTKVENLLMIIDACRSGHIKFPGRRGGKTKDRITLFTGQVDKAAKTSGGGWGAISATASDAFSFESQSGWEMCHFDPYRYTGGLFTCHMLSALAGKADSDKSGTVTAGELFGFLSTNVSFDSQGHQIPQQSGDLDPDLVLGTPTVGVVQIPRFPEKSREKSRDRDRGERGGCLKKPIADFM